MAKLPNTASKQHAYLTARCITTLFITLFLILLCTTVTAERTLPEDQVLFLVATEQLEGTSFQETVILLTHYSARGATGLTINRPTDIPVEKILPRIPQLKLLNESLYLGGPVSTNAIFVLLRTDQPGENMHRIAKDIYFSTAKNAFSDPISGSSRTYAGYAGWAAGQLQAEIARGDWLLVHTEPGIIFEKNPDKIWHRLSKRWSGQWL